MHIHMYVCIVRVSHTVVHLSTNLPTSYVRTYCLCVSYSSPPQHQSSHLICTYVLSACLIRWSTSAPISPPHMYVCIVCVSHTVVHLRLICTYVLSVCLIQWSTSAPIFPPHMYVCIVCVSHTVVHLRTNLPTSYVRTSIIMTDQISLVTSRADRAHTVYPNIEVSRCHTFDIKAKFLYKCTKCDYSTQRHSKSVNVTKSVCPYCFR